MEWNFMKLREKQFFELSLFSLNESTVFLHSIINDLIFIVYFIFFFSETYFWSKARWGRGEGPASWAVGDLRCESLKHLAGVRSPSVLLGILNREGGQKGRGDGMLWDSPWSVLNELSTLRPGCQTHFAGGHISLAVAFQGPNVVLGLYKWKYSLTVKWELGIAARQK